MNNKFTFERSIFIDTSILEEITKWNDLGLIDGVTMNQFILLSDGIKPREFSRRVKDICKAVKNKPVSVELTDSTISPEAMVKEAKKIYQLAPNIVIKVPLIPQTTKSLYVIKELIKSNIPVNITTIMTYEQLVMAILATRYSKKQCFVSLFWGRSIEDQAKYRGRSDFMAMFPRVGSGSKINEHPKYIIEAAIKFLNDGKYTNPKIIIGSIRSAAMAGEAFASGGHIITIAPDILVAMLYSQRSIETIEQFDQAWKSIQSKK